MNRQKQSKPKNPPNAMPLEGNRLWKATNCAACGSPIGAGEDRAALVVTEVFTGYDENDNGKRKLALGAEVHFCQPCMGTLEHFQIANPWRRSNVTSPDAKRADLIRKYEDLAADSNHQIGADIAPEIARSLDAGDMETFNKAMPTHARAGDVLDHFTSLEEMSEKMSSSDRDEGERKLNAASTLDIINSTGVPAASPFYKIAGQDHLSPPTKLDVESRNKSTLREFLASPRSSKIRPDIREMARLWINGASHSDIAKTKSVNQSTVSRHIKTALDQANRPV